MYFSLANLRTIRKLYLLIFCLMRCGSASWSTGTPHNKSKKLLSIKFYFVRKVASKIHRPCSIRSINYSEIKFITLYTARKKVRLFNSINRHHFTIVPPPTTYPSSASVYITNACPGVAALCGSSKIHSSVSSPIIRMVA